jgi:hypothetical protein
MTFRGITQDGHWQPVFVCDSRLLCTMMLKAWNPDADREMRRGMYREIYGTDPVTLPTTETVVRLEAG